MSKGVQSDVIVIFLGAFLGFPGQFVAAGGCFHHVNEITFVLFCFVCYQIILAAY